LPIICQVVVVDVVAEINVAVLEEIWVKYHANESQIVPAANLVADVKQRGGKLHVILENPNPSDAFPGIHSASSVERHTGDSGPVAADIAVDKAAWHGRSPQY